MQKRAKAYDENLPAAGIPVGDDTAVEAIDLGDITEFVHGALQRIGLQARTVIESGDHGADAGFSEFHN